MIKNSLEWSNKREYYKEKIHSLPYNREIRMLLTNIDSMIQDLSKAEVVARRSHKKDSVEAELKKVNDAIDTLEKWIMFGAFLN